MAEGGDDGKRRRVLDVLGAPGLQTYLKGALGAARAEAAAAPPPSGDAHRVRVLRAEGILLSTVHITFILTRPRALL
jgi:hypothetical protein